MKEQRHVGAYALIRDGGRMVLIRKGRGAYTGLWDLPGGSLEFGEEPLAALRREVMEETGLTVVAARLLDAVTVTTVYERDGEPCRLHHVGILYDVRAEGELKEDWDGLDSLGAAWVEVARGMAGVSGLVRRAVEGGA